MDLDDIESPSQFLSDDQACSPDDTTISEETISLVTETVVTPWQDVVEDLTAIDPSSVFSLGSDSEDNNDESEDNNNDENEDNNNYESEDNNNDVSEDNNNDDSEDKNDSEDLDEAEPAVSQSSEGDDLTAVDPTTVFPEVQQSSRWTNTNRDVPRSFVDRESETRAKRVIDEVNNNTVVDNHKPKRKRFGYKVQSKRGRARSVESPSRPMPTELTNYLNLAPVNAASSKLSPKPIPIHVGSGQHASIDYSKLIAEANKSHTPLPVRRHLSLPSPRLTSPRLPSPRLTSPHLPSPRLTSPRLPSPRLTSPRLPSPRLTSPRLPSLHLTSPHLPPPHLPSPRLPPPAPARIQAHFPPIHLAIPQHQRLQQEPLCLTLPRVLPDQPVITVPISPELSLTVPITQEALQKLALPNFANALASTSTFTGALSSPPVRYTLPAANAMKTEQPTRAYRRARYPSGPPLINPIALSSSSLNNRYSTVKDAPAIPIIKQEVSPQLPSSSSTEDVKPPTPSPTSVKSPAVFEFEEQASGQTYRCEDCLRTFKHKLSLTNHQRAHGNKQPHICFICKEPFKYKTNLKRHLRIHARQMRMCKYCHSIMDSDYDLVQHEKEHRRVMAVKEAEAKAAELEANLLNASIVKKEPDSTTAI